MVLAVMSFQNCSDASFSKSSGGDGGAGAQNVDGGEPGIIPEFGNTLDCNSDFNLSVATLSAVSCTTETNEGGIYICRIPLDGQGSVDTLCLTIQQAEIEVANACVCEEEQHGHDCHDRHDHIWNWFKYIKEKKEGYHTSSGYYDEDSDSESSDEDSYSSDDDSDSSDDDSNDHGPEVCVPSETVQYRLGNCAELF